MTSLLDAEPVSRERLYEQVWQEPMTAVAERYGVSSSFLARVCEQLGVPRPPRGYWARLKVGKAAERPALTPPVPGSLIEWSRGAMPAKRAPAGVPKPPPAHAVLRKRSGERPSRHQLVSGVHEAFLNSREIHSFLGSGYLRPYKRKLVDVFVSEGTLDDALSAANAVFLALEERGHRVVLNETRECRVVRPESARDQESDPHRVFAWHAWVPNHPTTAFVGTVAIGLTVYELPERVPVRWVDGTYVRVEETRRRSRHSAAEASTSTHDMPSGRLALRAYSPYQRTTWELEWREHTAGDLKGRCAQITQALEQAAPSIARQVSKAAQQIEAERVRWEQQHKEWERQDAERRERDAEKKSRDELLGIIECWALACRVEAFFADAENRCRNLPDSESTGIISRLNTARELIGTVDAAERLRQWKTAKERLSD